MRASLIFRAISLLEEGDSRSIYLGKVGNTEHWVHAKPGETRKSPSFQDRVKKQQDAYKKLKAQASKK